MASSHHVLIVAFCRVDAVPCYVMSCHAMLCYAMRSSFILPCFMPCSLETMTTPCVSCFRGSVMVLRVFCLMPSCVIHSWRAMACHAVLPCSRLVPFYRFASLSFSITLMPYTNKNYTEYPTSVLLYHPVCFLGVIDILACPETVVSLHHVSHRAAKSSSRVVVCDRGRLCNSTS